MVASLFSTPTQVKKISPTPIHPIQLPFLIYLSVPSYEKHIVQCLAIAASVFLAMIMMYLEIVTNSGLIFQLDYEFLEFLKMFFLYF